MASVDVAKDIPYLAFPKAAYPAVLKPNGNGLHEELFSELIKVPDDANFFSITADRKSLSADKSLCIKCRVELSLDGGATWSTKPSGELEWPFGVFPLAFTIAGGVILGADKKPLDMTIVTMPLPDVTGRLVRVTLIPIKDSNTEISFSCGQRK